MLRFLAITLLVLLSATAAGAQELLPPQPPYSAGGEPVPYVYAEAPPNAPYGGETWPAPSYRPAYVQDDWQAQDVVVESTWYTRVDYFHWNERIDGYSLLNEDGVFTTLGYQHRHGPERFRFEFFGGDVHYDGLAQYDDGSEVPLVANTNYLGLRGEYDLVFDPLWWPGASWFLGAGTRAWVRDLPDSFDALDNPVFGYTEFWWTIYPFVGLETRRTLGDAVEFYSSGRVGLTAITLQHVTLGDVNLYPRPGVLTAWEAGVRGRNLSLALHMELMNWGESAIVRDWLQPNSTLFTAGVEFAVSF